MVLTASIPVRTRTARRQRRSHMPRWMLIAVEIAVPVLIVAIWWIASAGSTNTFFPPLQRIVERMIALSGTPQFLVNVGSSVGNLLLSFALATVIGIVVGALLGLIRPLAWLVEPLLHFFRAIPPVALIPIFVALIGFGNETRILSITIASVFPVLISTMDGIQSIDPVPNMVSRAYRLSPRERLLEVVFPAASPRILSGMQVSLITAFVVMIASKMLGSSTGLGAATLLAQQTFTIADMWAGVLMLGIIGYAVSALFNIFRRWILRWYIASQEQEKNL